MNSGTATFIRERKERDEHIQALIQKNIEINFVYILVIQIYIMKSHEYPQYDHFQV